LADDPPEEHLDLQEAIARASRYVGSPGIPAQTPTTTVRYDASTPRRIRLVVLGTLLAATVVGAGYLSLRPRPPLPPQEQEADLRWAVARVVGQVETFRNEHGRLPAAQDLYGLLSDAVVYVREGSHYRVIGDRGGVRVTYDGSVPLDEWVARKEYSGTDDHP
jgi:hypothetical protein